MAELEQALRELPDDPTLAPEPLTAIEARAARRRRRRRWQGGGAVAVAAVAVLFVGIAAFVDDRPQVVSAANTGREATLAPSATGRDGAPPTTTPVPEPARPGDIIDTTQATPAPRRVAVPTTLGGTPEPESPSPSVDSGTSEPTTTTVPVSEPEIGLCPLAQVGITTATEQVAYVPGDPVRGWSSLRNDSDTTCLLSPRAFFRVEDSAGRVVGSFANTADIRPTARTEPGQSISSSITWDQKDCSGPVCAQVPAGTYTLVADWTEGLRVTGTAPFQIGP